MRSCVPQDDVSPLRSRQDDLDDVFPGSGPITFDVQCRAAPADHDNTHPVTVFPDWSIETGHDLRLESIASAFSTPSLCLALAEKGMQAIKQWRRYCRRVAGVPIHITPGRAVRYRPDERVPKCENCAYGGWTSVEKAMTHLRSLEHWCSAFGYPISAAAAVWQAMVVAGDCWAEVGRQGWILKGTDTGEEQLRSAFLPLEPPDAFIGLGYNEYCAETLWDAGIHPKWVADIFEALPMDELMLPGTLIEIAVRRPSIEWLSQFTQLGAAGLDWAARNYDIFDEWHPLTRTEWLKAGVSQSVTQRLLGGPYTIDDVKAVAEMLDTEINPAGAYLAGWLNAGCSPTVDQIRFILSRPDSMRVAPNSATIKRLKDSGLTSALSPTDLGVILAVTGSYSVAEAALKLAHIGGLNLIESIEHAGKKSRKRNELFGAAPAVENGSPRVGLSCEILP